MNLSTVRLDLGVNMDEKVTTSNIYVQLSELNLLANTKKLQKKSE